MKTNLKKSIITQSRTILCVRSKASTKKVFKIPGGFYLQPNGTNFYLTPAAFKYLQP